MRKLLLLLVCLVPLFAGTGCSKLAEYIRARAAASRASGAPEDGAGGEGLSPEDASAGDAVRTPADITYTNSYLGFSFTVPKGWWLYSVNDTNFNEDPSTTGSPELLDINYGEDAGMNYSYIGLVSFGSLRDSRRDNHIGFDISAESLEGIYSLDEYMEYLENYMLRPDENTYRVTGSGREEIEGLWYEKRRFEVLREEDNFMFVTYTRPLGNDYYLTIKADYWPDNRGAETFILLALSKAAR